MGESCGHWTQHRNANAHRYASLEPRLSLAPVTESGTFLASALLTTLSTVLGTQTSSSTSMWATLGDPEGEE